MQAIIGNILYLIVALKFIINIHKFRKRIKNKMVRGYANISFSDLAHLHSRSPRGIIKRKDAMGYLLEIIHSKKMEGNKDYKKSNNF